MADREPDLDALLHADGQSWRDQVDAARPDFVTTPVRRGPSTRHYVAGLVAAALVVGLAVLVVSLRPDGRGTIRAGAPVTSGSTTGSSAIPNPLPRVSASTAPSEPVSAPPPAAGRVPQVAYCPTTPGGSNTGSGFGVSVAQGASGEPSIEAAAAKYPPKDAQWTIVAQNDHAALLTYASHFLHLVRLPDGTWVVDSGGDCGGADATVVR